MSKCLGCGIKLQNEDPDKVGYVINLEHKYCKRCFRIRNYNENIKVFNTNNENIINKINKLGIFTIFITDFLSINAKLINTFKAINNEKILVINKCDLIPNNLKLENLEKNIKKIYGISDVMFISAKKSWYLNSIIDLVEMHKEVIICGETSSGKSTLINKVFSSNLTTSKYSNTTLDFVKLKKDNYVIYDTPGLCLNDYDSYDNIKVITKSLKEDFVLTIGDLKLKGKGNITCFLSSNINITSKKENINLNYKLHINNDTDIILFNKGFIYVKANTYLEANQELEIRNSVIE